MICKACNKVSNPTEIEDCFEKALDVLKKHYTFYKNALQQRDLELQQVKERNEKLDKALQLLQNNSQQPAKRFKSQHCDTSWLSNSSSQDDRVISDLSLTDDEPMGGTNLNMALNSEQLFDISALSQTKNEVSLTSSSELVQSPRAKELPKRNKQRDQMRLLKDRNNKCLERSKSEWHTKERNSPVEKSWAMKFLQPNKTLPTEEKIDKEGNNTKDKKLCLSLKKPNPSKVKQSLLNFNKAKDGNLCESDIGEDIIDASPVIINRNSKAGRSWAHRSGPNPSSTNNSNLTSNTSTNALKDVTIKKDDSTNKILDDIVFDFSPSKKTDSVMDLSSPETKQPKQLKFDNDISKDCTSMANENLGISTNKTDTSSVVILTPGTQDIIFVDDSCSEEAEIDTMDLLADIIKQGSTDNLEKLKIYESKCIQKQQNKEQDLFKKPANKTATNSDLNPLNNIKQEKITQDLKAETKIQTNEGKPSCSTSSSSNSSIKTTKPQNPLLSSEERDTEDDEDFMPKPFVIKQEPHEAKLSIKQRFNIDCENCEKLINFLDKGLTDVQIQQHLDKCKHHNNQNIRRQNTPEDFWNPFILSFQPDDPRNEVLIDNRFKDSKK